MKDKECLEFQFLRFGNRQLSESKNDRLRGILLAVLTVTLAANVHARRSDVEVSMTKVEGTTAVDSRLAGEMDAEFSRVAKTLCNLPNHAIFTDSIESQIVINQKLADQILSTPPENADQARELLPDKSLPSGCPGVYKTLTIIKFPWPMADSWSLLEFSSTVTEGQLKLTQKQLVGKSEDTSGVWNVKDVGRNKSKFEALFRMDLGYRMPKFLLDWAARSQMPKMFDSIEIEATRAQ